MDRLKILGIVLIAIGILWLGYGQFSYTEQRHRTDLGPVEFSVEETRRVSLPSWVGVGAIAVGGTVLIYGWRRGSEG